MREYNFFETIQERVESSTDREDLQDFFDGVSVSDPPTWLGACAGSSRRSKLKQPRVKSLKSKESGLNWLERTAAPFVCLGPLKKQNRSWSR
jgi:hypothetical protein